MREGLLDGGRAEILGTRSDPLEAQAGDVVGGRVVNDEPHAIATYFSSRPPGTNRRTTQGERFTGSWAPSRLPALASLTSPD